MAWCQVVSIEDITPFVIAMRDTVVAGGEKVVKERLLTPLEQVVLWYFPAETETPLTPQMRQMLAT